MQEQSGVNAGWRRKCFSLKPSLSPPATLKTIRALPDQNKAWTKSQPLPQLMCHTPPPLSLQQHSNERLGLSIFPTQLMWVQPRTRYLVYSWTVVQKRHPFFLPPWTRDLHTRKGVFFKSSSRWTSASTLRERERERERQREQLHIWPIGQGTSLPPSPCTTQEGSWHVSGGGVSVGRGISLGG